MKKLVFMSFPIAMIFGAWIAIRTVDADSNSGNNWPQWRGPQRNGISKETGLLKEWPKEGPRLVWQLKDIGTGYSTPAVVGERIYLLSNQGMDNEFVQALDVKDGKQIWSTRLGKVGNPNQYPSYPAARSTPTVVDNLLYALGSDGDLACLEISDGKVKWQKSLRKDFGGEPGVWAYAESPLIDGDVLVCTPGGTEAAVVALNRKTGDVIWKCSLPEHEQAAYASAIVVDAGGVKQYVQYLQKGTIGLDAKTGRLLWRYDRTAQGSSANIPTPLAHGAFVYTAAGQSGGALLKIKVNNDVVAAEPLYFVSKLPNGIGGAVLVDNYLYGSTRGPFLCVDFATGSIKWEDRSIGASSVCFADGRLYLHGENGQVALVEATPEAYREKGRFTPPAQPDRGRSQAWAHPVVANGRLYIRDLGTLWCYDIKE